VSASRRIPVSTPASAAIGYRHPTVALQHLDRDLDNAELHEPESFLDSPGLADTAMDLYGIDGFFAAILSGPRTLMPSEWMPSIWDPNGGDAAPEFENLEHANRILGLLMRHYNTVARVLLDEPEEIAPIYLDGDLGGAASWCSGYLAGRFGRRASRRHDRSRHRHRRRTSRPRKVPGDLGSPETIRFAQDENPCHQKSRAITKFETRGDRVPIPASPPSPRQSVSVGPRR